MNDEIREMETKKLLQLYYQIQEKKRNTDETDREIIREELEKRGIKLTTVGQLFDLFRTIKKSAKD